MRFLKNFPTTYVILVCVFLFLFNIFFYFNKAKFNDTAYFGGDTWEYQSMAVNWAKGYGLKFGGIEAFENYKFDSPKNVSIESYDRFISFNKNNVDPNKISINFYRTPGYPFFLGVVYKLFGIYPLVAKQIQLILLILIASFLPLVGYNYWKLTGFFSGIISNFIFLDKYYQTLPSEILTEPLITFFMFAIVISFIVFEKKKNSVTAFFFGIVLGLSLLVKGSNTFILLSYILYFIFQVINKKIKFNLLIFYSIGILLIVLPWSIYASTKTKKIILLSTQGNNALLDCNNEFSKDGSWHPEGYSSGKNVYYNRPEIKKLPVVLKLTSFYANYYQIVPTMIFNKVKRGFESFLFLKISLVFIILRIFISYLLILKNKKLVNTISAMVTLMAIFVLLQIIFQPAFNYPFKTTLLKLTQTPVLIGLIALLHIFLFKKIQINIPVTFKIYFFNFLLITLIFFGISRYTGVIDFAFILIAINYLLSLLKFLYFSIYNSYSKNIVIL